MTERVTDSLNRGVLVFYIRTAATYCLLFDRARAFESY